MGDRPTRGALYRGYSKGEGIDTKAVRALFTERYGYEPLEIHDAKTVWLAGPVATKRLSARVSN
jgi:hypothetical protein